MKISVISGGFSEESGSSRESGICVAKALTALGHEVAIVEYDENIVGRLKKTAPDAAFPVVQGKHHGDGAVQAILELLGIPYVGSRPSFAALINHKTLCKKIWRAAEILTPDFFEYSRDEYDKDDFADFAEKAEVYDITLPVVVKPPTQGNRFGMVFVKDALSFAELKNSFKYDEILLGERYIEGRFITQGIVEIGGKMTEMPPVEVLDDSANEFKTFPGGSATRKPDLSPGQLAEINRTTLEAAALTGASGFARLDYHLSGGRFYLLEINAVPGVVPGYSSMTACAQAAGYDYNAFIGILLDAANNGG